MLGVIRFEKDDSARAYDEVVLGADDVFQQDSASAAALLDLFVKGQVQGDDLYARIGLAGIVESVAGKDLGAGTGLEGLVGGISGEFLLEFSDPGYILHQFPGVRLIFQQDERLVGSFDAHQLIIRHFVGADNQVHLTVFHIQPGERTLIITVCPEGFRLAEQIGRHAGLDGNVGRSLQIITDLVDMFLVGVVVPQSLQGPVRSAADQGIRAVLVRVVPGIELLPGHIRRVKTGTGKTVGIAFHERFSRGPVPGTVIDFGESLLDGIRYPLQKVLPASEILFPVDGVPLVRRKAVEVEYFLAVVGNTAEVRSLDINDGIFRHVPGERRFRIFARHCGEQGENR